MPIAPMIVPIRALESVKPSRKFLSSKVFFNQSVVPEITAVSNPKSRPPRAATTVLLKRKTLIFVSMLLSN